MSLAAATCRELAVVTVALNAQQYLPIGVNFSAYPPNRVVRLSPSTGTVLGGTVVTVSGTDFRSFAEHPVLCRFGNRTAITTLIDASTLECVAPPATLAAVAVALDPSFPALTPPPPRWAARCSAGRGSSAATSS